MTLAPALQPIRGMNAKAWALQARTNQFFVRVIRFCESLPECPTTSSIRDQLLDSAGSTDSNYRAACRGRSRAEFIAKVGVSAEEADESKGWLEALFAVGYGEPQEAQALIREADELTAIFTSSQKTARERLEAKKVAVATAKRRRSRR